MNSAPHKSTPSVYLPGPATKYPIAAARKPSAPIIEPIADLVRSIMTFPFVSKHALSFQWFLNISRRSKQEAPLGGNLPINSLFKLLISSSECIYAPLLATSKKQNHQRTRWYTFRR